MRFPHSPLLRQFLSSCLDLLPILAVVTAFQLLVVRQPLPNLAGLAVGIGFVAVGLTLFVRGLQLALFPIGEGMAFAFARKGSLPWLVVFAFVLGFATTVAEPALIAVAQKAAEASAAGGRLTAERQAAYALGLRITVALAVGSALVLGVLRILKGWPLHWLILAGYALVMAVTPFAPREIIGIAYDSGGVTTSTITVPLVTALGVGLSTAVRGRNPLTDGFGLIALASLTPMIFVMLYGILR